MSCKVHFIKRIFGEPSTEQLADRFGKEMMTNLRRNVSEQKKRRAERIVNRKATR